MNEKYHSTVRMDIVPLVPKAARLLDVGGGTGATARYLRDIGRAGQVGVMDAVTDAERDWLDYASSVNLEDREAVNAFLTQTGPFDVILMLDVLEHLIDPWSNVDLFARHLAPGGAIIASIPNIRHFSVSARLLFCNTWRYTQSGLLDRTHLRFFVRKTAIELMDRPGLVVDHVAPSPIGRRLHKLMNACSLGLFRSFFTLQYFVVARRNA